MSDKLTYEELAALVEKLRNQAEAAEDLYRNLFENCHSIILIIHPENGAIMDANRAACRYFGYDRTRITTMTAMELGIVAWNDIQKAMKNADRSRRPDVNTQCRFPSGEIRDVEVASGPVTIGGQSLVYAVVRDVTEQRRAEEENRKRSERLRQNSFTLEAILNSIPDVIGVQDLHHDIHRFNRAGYAFFGVTPDEAKGKKCHELMGRTAPCETCAAAEVYRTKQTAHVEKYLEDRDIWVDTRAYPVFDESGRLIRVVEHLRDISSEKTAETVLKESHERFLTLLDAIDVHVCVTDFETYDILFMNKKMREDFQSDAVGKKCFAVLRREEAPCNDCKNKRLIDKYKSLSGEPLEWESVNPVTGKHYINYGRAIKWIDGQKVQLRVATDITRLKEYENEQRNMQDQLLQSRKMEAVGTLAGGIAHEFNNLMMVIQGRTSLMAMNIDASHPDFEHLKGIESCLDNAKDLTKQLLGVYRGGKYTIEATRLNDIVDQCAQIFGGAKKNIQIRKNYEKNLWEVPVDRKQIRQVILNLYVNAWQAMPDGGELSITTENVFPEESFCVSHDTRPGPFVKWSVKDTGIGMDPATLSRIFDPFFTTRGLGRGTGLGRLASVYGIIKSHHGIITASSDIGSGTMFSIFLPATVPAASPD